MPLSEQEQRLLDEMERSLYHNDADFVSAVGGGRGRLNYGALVLGILVGILGLGIVIGGVLLALRRSKRGRGAPASPSGSAGPARTSGSSSSSSNKSGFMDRLNDRWERRDDREE